MTELPMLEKPVKKCLVCGSKQDTNEYGRCRFCHRAYLQGKGVSYADAQINDGFIVFSKAPAKPKDCGNKRCVNCGILYYPTKKNQKHCSDECRRAYNARLAAERMRRIRHPETAEGKA